MATTRFPGARPLTAEEREALGWPAEPAGVDTVRSLSGEPRQWSKYGSNEPLWYYGSGRAVIETAEGGYFDTTVWRGTEAKTAEEATEKARKAALRQAEHSRRFYRLSAQWDRTVEAMAASNKRGRLGEGWTLEDHHRPVIGEHVRIWAHGGFRTGIVVETTRGRGITVAYATPASPRDTHFTKTTKYAVSTGVRRMSQGD